jgi:hypothetical protein
MSKAANEKTKLPKLPPPFIVKAVIGLSNRLEKLRTKLNPPSILLLEKITGYWLSQAIYVAAQLKIADHLAKGPKSVAELAQATGADEQNLYRLLRALASVGIFAQVKDDQFRLTAPAKYLRTDIPGSLHKMALMNGLPFHWRVWGNLLESVKTGQTGFQLTHGLDAFAYFDQHPEDGAVFNGAMTGFAFQDVPTILAVYDFSTVAKVADIGGGEGSLLEAILQAYSNLKGLLFDRAAVIEKLPKQFKEGELSHRVELKAGNFLEEVPGEYDIYLLKNILHDFDDETAHTILRNCRAAMPKNARLLIIEAIIPPGNKPFAQKLIDLEMLMMTPGGRERTETEYRRLLETAGFRLNRIIPTISPLSLIEAIPA